MSRAWLSLGGNIGDRAAYLSRAAQQLAAHPQIKLMAKSSLYRTAPWGGVAQADFYNAALEIETGLAPLDLLDVCQQIERDAGRTREVRWGARTLDIDLLLYDGLRLNNERLVLPHPYLAERLFVLVPLAEITPGGELPLFGSVRELIAACPLPLACEKISDAAAW